MAQFAVSEEMVGIVGAAIKYTVQTHVEGAATIGLRALRGAAGDGVQFQIVLEQKHIVQRVGVGVVDIGNEHRASSATELFHVGHGKGGGGLDQSAILGFVVANIAIDGFGIAASRGVGFETHELASLVTFAGVQGGHGERTGAKLMRQ